MTPVCFTRVARGGRAALAERLGRTENAL
jgi:hypothetical protein